jgi:hypothetical protein
MQIKISSIQNNSTYKKTNKQQKDIAFGEYNGFPLKTFVGMADEYLKSGSKFITEEERKLAPKIEEVMKQKMENLHLLKQFDDDVQISLHAPSNGLPFGVNPEYASENYKSTYSATVDVGGDLGHANMVDRVLSDGKEFVKEIIEFVSNIKKK